MAFGLSSCNDTMDDKADVEAGWTVLPTPTATATITETTFSGTTVSLIASDTVNIVEYGVQYATSEDFADGKFAAANIISKSAVEVSVSNLTEQTKYYIRPYVITRNSYTAFGDVITTTTPAAPYFPLEGTYTALDYTYDDSGNAAPGDATYEVEVVFVEGSTTDVTITNLWDGGETITGSYDPETGIVTVASDQTVWNSEEYGACNAYEANDEDNMTFQFTSLGGSLVTCDYYVSCSLGELGFYKTVMTHK